MTSISFLSDAYKLAGNLFTPVDEPQELAFLFIQGWTGHQIIEAAQALADLGFSALTYDMRGNRESEGNLAEFSRADFVKDATVAYDYLRQQVGDKMPIGVIGSSFGSYTAVMLSGKRNVNCLSLRVPASYPDEGYDEPQLAQHQNSGDFNRWRQKALDHSENRAFGALHDFKGKVQIIEAGADETVPAQAPKNYANAMADTSRLTYEVIPGAPHRLADEELKADYVKRLAAWVSAL